MKNLKAFYRLMKNCLVIPTSTNVFSKLNILFLVIIGSVLVILSYRGFQELSKIYRSENIHLIDRSETKLWFFEHGIKYPLPSNISKETGRRTAILLPSESLKEDRFLSQLMFVPPNYHQSHKKKTILLDENLPTWWSFNEGSQLFKDLRCPVNACRMTTDKSQRKTADLVIFWDYYKPFKTTRHSNQLYALYHIEPPFITQPIDYPDVFNWTITYRYDSTIPTPYGKWLYYDPQIKEQEQTKNYALNKTKKVAWFVSKCNTWNDRMGYVKQLQNYIEVDIYGACGSSECPKQDQLTHTEECFNQVLRQYKFYLAFENSNCKGYITEKFFENGLNRDILPVVMGAARDEYERQAPLRSFIHVEDFKSPKDLAEYLHTLNQNDTLYNSYFNWKGTGELVNTWHNVWCQMCAMLHDNYSTSVHRWYRDMNDWWRGPGVCTKGYWRDRNTLNYTDYDYDFTDYELIPKNSN